MFYFQIDNLEKGKNTIIQLKQKQSKTKKRKKEESRKKK